MSRALRFTKTELATAAKVVSQHGVAVRLMRNGDMMVFPDTHTTSVDTSDEEDLDAELLAFEAKHGNGRA